MIEAALPDSPVRARYGTEEQPRRRALALAILVHIIAGLILLFQKREQFVKMGEQELKTFNVAPSAPKGSETEKTQQKEEKKTQAKRAASQDRPAEVKAPPPPPETQPPPIVKDFQPAFIELSREDYASSNVGNKASLRPAASATAGQQNSKAPYGPGGGPGGSTLYPADWFREPTSTETGGYLKPDMPREGWGEIGCKTVAQHHVEDCYVVGEYPRGSGFGRAVLNAAWQFLVLAPRVNGHEQVGAWVQIRITYYDGSIKTGPGG